MCRETCRSVKCPTARLFHTLVHVTVVTAPAPPATTYDYVAGCAHLLRNPPVNCAAAHFLVDFVHFATQIRQELAAAYLGTKRNESLVLRSCVKRSRLQKTAAATISQQAVVNSINYIYSFFNLTPKSGNRQQPFCFA